MTLNGIKLESRGKEIVNVYGEITRRTVYTVPGKWKFYVRVGGEFIEVYHKACTFSTEA